MEESRQKMDQYNKKMDAIKTEKEKKGQGAMQSERKTKKYKKVREEQTKVRTAMSQTINVSHAHLPDRRCAAK
jgi:glycine cleavage system protein P-like pyridoxal-binding family